MATGTNTIRYRSDIDGLRAVAVLLVLVFHFELFGLGKSGFIGVDVFFVISGYLISSIIWKNLGDNKFTLGDFYLRRIRRLLPPLVAVQVGTLIVGCIFLVPNELLSLSKESIFVQLYSSNFYYWRTLDYFGLQTENSFLLHTWSLGIEEQFYIFYPLLLLLIFKFARAYFLPILALLVVGSFALNMVLVESRPWATFYLLPTRAWELGFGAMLPFAERYFDKSTLLRVAAAIVGTGLLIAAVALYDKSIPFPGSFALLPVVGSGLIILGGTGAGTPMNFIMSSRLMVAIGNISYSLYLVHWPLKTFAQKLIVEYDLAARWMMFFVSFFLAIAIYRLVENPTRRKTVLPSSRSLVKFAIGFFMVIVLSATAIIAANGWPGRFSEKAASLAAASQDVDPTVLDWEEENKVSGGFNYREIGRDGSEPTWLIIGDSHAPALSTAVSNWLTKNGEAGLIGFRPGCMPVQKMGSSGCQNFNEGAVELLQSDGKIKDILLISIWQQLIESEIPIDEFEMRLAETLQTLNSAGVNVHIWEPIPKAKRSVPETLARNEIFGFHWPVRPVKSEHRKTFEGFVQVLDRHEDKIATRIDPADWLCPNERCNVTLDGKPLFSDSNHPAYSASPYFAQIFDQSGEDQPKR